MLWKSGYARAVPPKLGGRDLRLKLLRLNDQPKRCEAEYLTPPKTRVDSRCSTEAPTGAYHLPTGAGLTGNAEQTSQQGFHYRLPLRIRVT
jgi:hypothetical protein